MNANRAGQRNLRMALGPMLVMMRSIGEACSQAGKEPHRDFRMVLLEHLRRSSLVVTRTIRVTAETTTTVQVFSYLDSATALTHHVNRLVRELEGIGE